MKPMKKLLLVSLGGVLISAILLSACSKSPNKTFQTENSAGPGQVAVASDSPVDMRIKWTTGKKYPMHIELTQASKTDLPNQAQPVVQELKLTQDFSFSPLKELDNGGHQLELTFENLVIDVSQGGK